MTPGSQHPLVMTIDEWQALFESTSDEMYQKILNNIKDRASHTSARSEQDIRADERKKFKTSIMQKHEENYPIFEVNTEYPNGTHIVEYKRPNLPLYVRIAIIGLYDENCVLRRELRRQHQEAGK